MLMTCVISWMREEIHTEAYHHYVDHLINLHTNEHIPWNEPILSYYVHAIRC